VAESLLVLFPWLTDLGWAVGALVMIALMVYFLKPTSDSDFTIHVNGDAVTFRGRIASGSRAEVEHFLLNDVRVEGAYSVRGKWDGRVLVVSVTGAGKMYEQRIRNFLKLALKPPLRAGDD
jgi:hypothetical protein